MNVVHKEFDVAAESGDEQIVGGFITTANRDRHGDVVEATGVDTSQLKVLLEGHNHDKPVGRLIGTEVRDGGVYARFKVLTDDAWAKVKAGLYPAFSIGFIPKVAEPMKGSDGGWLYKAIEVIETSLVAIPSNRESLISEVRNAPSEGDTMNDKIAPTGKKVAPAVHTERHEYSLQKALASVLEQRVPAGLEGETDQELRHAQPGREFGGCAVPIEQVFLTKDQRDTIAKASGVYDPTNLAPLTGVDYRDELFARISDAIGKQMIMGQLGVRTLAGLTEDTIRIPRQTGMMSAAHTAIDTDLPDSSDPTFSNQLIRPKLVGSIAQLQLSAILAQHPRIGTDFIGNELRRALVQELERVFISGDEATTPAEPDGLVILADNSNALTIATATLLADWQNVEKVYRDYTQDLNNRVSWVLPPELLEAGEHVASFSNSRDTMTSVVLRTSPRIVNALNLPETTGIYTGFVGQFDNFVHAIWQGIDVSLNPWETTVFAKKATLLRVSMLHGQQIIDPKKILQVAVTP